RNHVEVIGTSGEAPEQVVVVESVEEAESLEIEDPDKVAYVTQTTLSVDDTRDILEALKRRFPNIVSPSKLDICYATQNRQDAVKALAKQADIIFIMGSPESSNSNRLVEVAKASGVKDSYLIEGADNLDRSMFRQGMVVGLSSGASTPETVVLEVIARLKEFGARDVEELDGKEEHTRFPFPDAIQFKSASNN
ncbi:MAG: 4-hydroxy-3-methylbut-2-enyl diphosphate reductase, partial [Thermodesulfobacteriota bacterium]